jgi:hypothetical protein
MKLDQDFVAYLMEPWEAFARAYCQWVLEDSDDESAKQLITGMSNDNFSLYPQQWAHDEFDEIRAELEKVFAKFEPDKKDITPDFVEREHPRDPTGRFRDKPDIIEDVLKIPRETLLTARWPLSISDGDWKEKVEAVQGKLPTPLGLKIATVTEGLPDDLAEIAKQKVSGNMLPSKWNVEIGKRLDALPVGTKIFVWPNPTESYSMGITNGQFVKNENGEWIKRGVTESDSRNSIISNPMIARAIAEATGEFSGPPTPGGPPRRQEDFYEDLDKVMDAGNAIHAEVGRRLREKGFYHIQVMSDEERAQREQELEHEKRLAAEDAHQEIVKEASEIMVNKYNPDFDPYLVEQFRPGFNYSSPYLDSRKMQEQYPDFQERIRVERQFSVAVSDARKKKNVQEKLKAAQLASDASYNFRYDQKLSSESDKFKMRRETIREVLSEIREMGGEQYEFKKHTREKPISVAQQVAKWLPDAWVKASNDKHRPGAGSFTKLKVKFVKGRGFYDDIDDAANASPWRSRVQGDNGYFSVMAHELIHRAEYTVPSIKMMEWVYYHRRTKGELPQQLQKLYPGKRYRKDEITREDKFVDPYAGKDYGNDMRSAYEIMTTGVQDMLTGVMGISSFDADQTKFVLGMLAAA